MSCLMLAFSSRTSMSLVISFRKFYFAIKILAINGVWQLTYISPALVACLHFISLFSARVGILKINMSQNTFKTLSKGSESSVYAVVTNIPNSYHSADLRRFFSTLVEKSCFDCFHFRHRPEIKQEENPPNTSKKVGGETFCCVVKLPRKHLSNLITMYSRYSLCPSGV